MVRVIECFSSKDKALSSIASAATKEKKKEERKGEKEREIEGRRKELVL